MANWRESNVAHNIHASTLPIILPSSGTIGNNGALSGLTALPLAFPNCFMYFPAGAIEAGSAAGLYYVEMSSTSAGTIYNNVLDFENVEIPASPTPFTTVGPGAYTQTTGAAITLVKHTMGGGSMGIKATLNLESQWSYLNSAGAKTLKYTFGGQTVQQYSVTTTAYAMWHADVTNRGRADRQVASPFNVPGHSAGSAGVASYFSVDTAADVELLLTAQLAVATDFVIQQRSHFELD